MVLNTGSICRLHNNITEGAAAAASEEKEGTTSEELVEASATVERVGSGPADVVVTASTAAKYPLPNMEDNHIGEYLSHLDIELTMIFLSEIQK